MLRPFYEVEDFRAERPWKDSMILVSKEDHREGFHLHCELENTFMHGAAACATGVLPELERSSVKEEKQGRARTETEADSDKQRQRESQRQREEPEYPSGFASASIEVL
jgi:hypothetical protein